MWHDPELVAETRAWLVRAVDDLREAEHDLTAAPPLLRGAVFHCQQAAEKAMKGSSPGTVDRSARRTTSPRSGACARRWIGPSNHRSGEPRC